jgi:hypothetical protein
MELTKPFRESNPRVSYLTCQRSDLYFKNRFLKLLDQQRWTALECYKHSTFRVKIKDGVLVGVKIKQKYICARKYPRFDPVMTSTEHTTNFSVFQVAHSQPKTSYVICHLQELIYSARNVTWSPLLLVFHSNTPLKSLLSWRDAWAPL